MSYWVINELIYWGQLIEYDWVNTWYNTFPANKRALKSVNSMTYNSFVHHSLIQYVVIQSLMKHSIMYLFNDINGIWFRIIHIIRQSSVK